MAKEKSKIKKKLSVAVEQAKKEKARNRRSAKLSNATKEATGNLVHLGEVFGSAVKGEKREEALEKLLSRFKGRAA